MPLIQCLQHMIIAIETVGQGQGFPLTIPYKIWIITYTHIFLIYSIMVAMLLILTFQPWLFL